MGSIPVADPGFPVGGGAEPLGGHQLPMQALFSENICENGRIGSHWGGGGTPAAPLDPPMDTRLDNTAPSFLCFKFTTCHQRVSPLFHINTCGMRTTGNNRNSNQKSDYSQRDLI